MKLLCDPLRAFVLVLGTFPGSGSAIFRPGPSYVGSSSRYLETTSSTANHIFNKGPFTDEEKLTHVANSHAAFEDLNTRVDAAVQRGSVVFMEDSESDDLSHLLMSYRKGLVPRYLCTRGGYWLLRRNLYEEVSDYGVARFNSPKPPDILVLHGEKEDFSVHDRVEGTGLFTADQIESYQLASKDTYHTDLQSAIDKAGRKLLQMLRREAFTLIVLKTAPSGLPKIIKSVPNYHQKVAIIWTAPIDVSSNGNFVTKFNFYQDPEASDELLKLGVPIIMMSPFVGEAHMNTMVDRNHMEIFKKYTPNFKTDFPGFEGLAELSESRGLFGKLLYGTATAFMREGMDLLKNEDNAALAAAWYKTDAKIRRLEAAGAPETRIAEEQARLNRIQDELPPVGKLALRWTSIQNVIQDFWELVIVDHYALPLTDPKMRRDTVQEVVRASVRRDPSQGEKVAIVTPDPQGSVFIVSKINSGPLQVEVEKLLDWIRQGEPQA